MQNLLSKADNWKLDCIAARVDVVAACGHLTHDHVARGLEDHGARAVVIVAFFGEMLGRTADVVFHDVEVNDVAFGKGSCQGGTDTYFHWNNFDDSELALFCDKFDFAKIGFMFNGVHVDVVVWVDNMWPVFAHVHGAEPTMGMITGALYSRRV